MIWQIGQLTQESRFVPELPFSCKCLENLLHGLKQKKKDVVAIKFASGCRNCLLVEFFMIDDPLLS